MGDINNIQVKLDISKKNELTNYFTNFQQQIQMTRNTVNVFNQTIAATKNKLGLGDFNTYASALEASGRAFQSAGGACLSFEQGLVDLSIRTGITGAALAAVSDRSRQLGASSGLGAGEALKAYQLLASQVDISRAGLKGLKVLQEKTMTLAKASGMEVEGAATALAGTITQFGMEADQAGRVMNVLAAGAKYGAAGIPELAQALGAAGAMARSAGVDVESATGALEVLSRANLKGAEAGKTLGEVMQAMQTSLGVDFNTTSLASGLESLKPRLNDAAYLTQLFGANNVAAAQYLIENASAVEEMTTKVTGSNVAQEQANLRGETTASKMAVMREWIENLKYTLFEMTGGWSGYLSIMGEVMGGIANFIPLIGLLNQMETITATVIKFVGVAQKGLNAAFKACPLVWIVAAITLLVQVITWVCSKITGWGSLWNGVTGFMKYSFLAFVEGVKLYWNTWINGFMIGINQIMKSWYRFKNAMGMGDEGENNAAIAKIDADTTARQQALVDGAKRVMENARKAKESLDGIQMGWKSDEEEETAVPPVTNSGLAAQPGLASANLPGADNPSLVPANRTLAPAVAQQSSQAAVTGGSRSTTVTVNLGKLMENVNIYAQEFRDGLNDLDNRVLESLTRVLNMAQSNAI